jgi:hypothetical protein
MTAHVVDPGSGIVSVSAYITRDLTGGGSVRYSGTLTVQSGTAHDSVYRGALTVPLHASSGVFAIHVVTVDKAGNRLDRALDRTIPVTAAQGDGEPAEVSDLDASPAAAVAGKTVTIRARIADRGDGGLVEAVASLVWSGGATGAVSARYEAPFLAAAGDYTATDRDSDGAPQIHRVDQARPVGTDPSRTVAPAAGGRWDRLVAGDSRLDQCPGLEKGNLTGPNPVDRGKPGSKIHVLCDRRGYRCRC